MQYFPLCFKANSFVKYKAILDTVPDVEIKNRFFLVFCIDLLHNNHNEAEWIFRKVDFEYALTPRNAHRKGIKIVQWLYTLVDRPM